MAGYFALESSGSTPRQNLKVARQLFHPATPMAVATMGAPPQKIRRTGTDRRVVRLQLVVVRRRRLLLGDEHRRPLDAARRSAQPPGHASPQTSPSLADELRKLAELRDAGVLSAEEFDAQKARLLDPPPS